MKTRKKYKKITRNRRSKIWKTRNRRSKIWKMRNRRTRTKNTKILIGGVNGEDYMSAYTNAINRFAIITTSPADRIKNVLSVVKPLINGDKFNSALNSVFIKHIKFTDTDIPKLSKKDELDKIIVPAVSEFAKGLTQGFTGILFNKALQSVGIILQPDNLITDTMKDGILQTYNTNRSLTDGILNDAEIVLLSENTWKEKRLAESRLAESRLAESRLEESRLAESRLEESRLEESRLEESRLAQPVTGFSSKFKQFSSKLGEYSSKLAELSKSLTATVNYDELFHSSYN